MAEVVHYSYRHNPGKSTCGKFDPTDSVNIVPENVTCIDCAYSIAKDARMAERYESTESAYGTPDRGMAAPQKEDPAISEHREGLSSIEKEMDQASRMMAEHRQHLLAEVRVLQAKMELSKDTIARITSFLNDEEAKVSY